MKRSPKSEARVLRKSPSFGKARWRAALAALAVTGAACAPVGPDFVPPELPADPAWLEAELTAYDPQPAALKAWWERLDDPVLNRLIDTAYENNNALKIAGLRIIEAQTQYSIATGSRFPQLQVLGGDATAIGSSKSSANSSDRDLSLVEYNLGATVSWELDFWGRFRRGIEAADANVLASVASYDDLMVLLTAQVADTYTLIRATEEQLRLARDSVAIQQRSYDIVEVLYRNGESAELDALQAKTLLLGTQTIIPNLEAALRQARYALGVLLGVTPGEVDGLLGGEGVLPAVPEQLSIGVPADLLRQRPDVRRAEMLARAQSALVGVAEASLYPSFSLNGALGLSSTDNTTSTRSGDSGLGQLFESSSTSYAVGASFVWPFFNYDRIRNSVRVEDARLQQALIAYRDTVLQAAAETAAALAFHAGTRAQDAILREGVAVARRSAELSLLRYQEGFADYQRVLNAQQALFSQQQRYAANRGDILRSLTAVYRSLGGGWEEQRSLLDEATRRQMQDRTQWGDKLDAPPEK